MERKVRIGVLGGFRGNSMISFCKVAENVELVAICDKMAEVLKAQQLLAEEDGYRGITYYDNFDEFIKHDMDAVVISNYANEHAPFAIRAMKEGKHVFSECVPVQNMKEAVELIETVESTGKIYCFAENYCYFPAVREMKKLYEENKIGEFEYGEAEYIHNCQPIWAAITQGDPNHWRNNMYSTFYCTHSIGPIIHATGLRPVKVLGMEGTKNERNLAGGAKFGQFGIVMITLENGALVKAINGGLYVNSVWYSMYGSKGTMESARNIPRTGGTNRIYVRADKNAGDYAEPPTETYEPKGEFDEKAFDYGHGSADYYCMWNFVEKIRGNENADTIDVYEALDMFLPGLFAHRSILAGNVPFDIPNLRNKEERDLWRDDVSCTDPRIAGDKLLPLTAQGTPEIEPEVYENVKRRWQTEFQSDNPKNYRAQMFKKVFKVR